MVISDYMYVSSDSSRKVAKATRCNGSQTSVFSLYPHYLRLQPILFRSGCVFEFLEDSNAIRKKRRRFHKRISIETLLLTSFKTFND
jgi:hypothetical protein